MTDHMEKHCRKCNSLLHHEDDCRSEMAEYYSSDYGDVSDYTDDGSCLYCGSDQGDKCKCTVTITHYGYGIVDKDGKPYYDESCVCQDPEPMQEIASQLNQTMKLRSKVVYDVRCPYRVVRLLYQEME